MRFSGHMAYIGEGGFRTGFWWGSLKEGDQLEDLGLDRKILLKWISKK
jgi:hypothetical protein